MDRRKAILALAVPLAGACGYRVGGKADLLPKTIHTIAIPAFSNITTRYKLSERLPAAIGREFLSRTRYQVVYDTAEADAILTGSVNNYHSATTIFDQASGRAAGIQVSVYLNIKLTNRANGDILYQRDNLEVRQRYEVSIEQQAYFDESEVALERLSREVARQVVSTVLEAF
ncbi:MAG TPA: LPS assembly lipoprotein LptE [Bryobacteraceae bacterium]|nr:LPS assembly lipoprotein LptE [Bryobacteraceae bacterium]HPT28519.1 LPS assembly lipoprotein LptE [Bryobacteraceae bacterium]